MRWSSGSFLQKFFTISPKKLTMGKNEEAKHKKEQKVQETRTECAIGSWGRSLRLPEKNLSNNNKSKKGRRRKEETAKVNSETIWRLGALSPRSMNLLRQCTLMTCTKKFLNGLKRKKKFFCEVIFSSCNDGAQNCNFFLAVLDRLRCAAGIGQTGGFLLSFCFFFAFLCAAHELTISFFPVRLLSTVFNHMMMWARLVLF